MGGRSGRRHSIVESQKPSFFNLRSKYSMALATAQVGYPARLSSVKGERGVVMRRGSVSGGSRHQFRGDLLAGANAGAGADQNDVAGLQSFKNLSFLRCLQSQFDRVFLDRAPLGYDQDRRMLTHSDGLHRHGN